MLVAKVRCDLYRYWIYKGVTVVYKANLQGQKVEEFPFFEDGNMHGPTFVGGQIASLHAEIV